MVNLFKKTKLTKSEAGKLGGEKLLKERGINYYRNLAKLSSKKGKRYWRLQLHKMMVKYNLESEEKKFEFFIENILKSHDRVIED